MRAPPHNAEAEAAILGAIIPGTTIVDFIGKHYRFQPREDVT